MARADMSKFLVHWIRHNTDEDAFDVLRQIVREQRLLGGDGLIKGRYSCVCFTEAPEVAFHEIGTRYRPMGIQVSKKWAFSEGGRPVIYQSDVEFNELADTQKWRHVRYEPDADPPIDFTWEREWRILADELVLPPGEARVIVPDPSWADALEDEHSAEEGHRIQMEAMAYGEEYLLQDPEPFMYPFSVINL